MRTINLFKKFLLFSITFLCCFYLMNSLTLVNASETDEDIYYTTEIIKPKAQWLFNDKNKLGYDTATEDGTNTYGLKTYGNVTYNEGALIGKDGSLYAATFNSDPTYKYSSGDFTLSFTFSYDSIGWTSQEGVVFQLRFSSSSENFSIFFPKNSNELKFSTKDDNTAGYSAKSQTIGILEAGVEYNIIFTRKLTGETYIYLNGNTESFITTSTKSVTFSSNWTTFSLGSESGCTSGGHNINRFTRHANGLKFKKAEFYNACMEGEDVSTYYQTGTFTTEVAHKYDDENMEPDYDLISNSKIISRVAFISDTHIRDGLTNPTNYGDQFVYRAIEDIESLGLDLDAVLNLGDLSESGMDRDNISLTNYYDWVDTNPVKNSDGSAVPFYGVLGNHDVRGDSNISHTGAERQEDFLKAAKVYQEREIYSDWKKSTYIRGSYSKRQESPDLNYYTTIGGYHYVFLNTCESQWDVCYLTNDNLKWLDETLTMLEQEAGNNPIFVLVHQPIDYTNDSIYLLEDDGTRSSNPFAFHEILAKHKTTICCTGHTHRPLGINHRFQNVEFGGVKVPNYINMPSLEYNNYVDYAPFGVTDYELKNMTSFSNIQYYICEIYENGVIFKGRDAASNAWIEESYMGIHKTCDVSFKVNGEIIKNTTARLNGEVRTPNVKSYKDEEYTYYFKKWIGYNGIVTEDAIYEAEFLKVKTGSETYSTVTYETNGHGGKNQKEQILNGLFAKNITLSEANLIFGGWYKDKELTTPYDFYKDEISSDITLYAKWEAVPISYTVEHYQEKLTPGRFEIVKKETLYGALNELTKAEAINFTGFFYMPVTQQTLTEGITIKIYYYREQYSVTFKNGDNIISTKEYLYGETIEMPSSTPTKDPTEKETYTFVGWDKEDSIVTGDMTFNAVFEATPIMYSVEIVNNEECGTYSPLENDGYAYGTKLTINFKPNKNYTVESITLNGEKIAVTNNTITIEVKSNIQLEINYIKQSGCSGSLNPSCIIFLITLLGFAFWKKKRLLLK